MKRLRAFILGRYPWAILAGLLLAVAFPTVSPGASNHGRSVAGFAWVAPGLILLCAIGKPPKQAFRIGYVAGLAHYLASLYWLLLIPVAWYPILGWVALSAFIALYPAVWVWLVWKMFPAKINGEGPLGFSKPALSPNDAVVWEAHAAGPAGGTGPAKTFPSDFPPTKWRDQIRGSNGLGEPPNPAGQRPALPAPNASLQLSEQFLRVPWARRMLWTLSGAALWVALEMLVSRLLGGFPWNLLGSSQFRLTPLIQIAATTGIYGLSFLLVWTSLSFVCAGMVIVRKPSRRSAWVGEIILPMLAVAILYAKGYYQLVRPDSPAREITVALIQPSIPQTMIWDEKEDAHRFGQLLQLSREALNQKPDVILWPEAALPGMLRYDKGLFLPVSELVRSNHVWMITGSDDMEPAPGGGNEFYNASFLINPEGRLMERYCKQNLVIFGEYVPLIKWLPFIKYFTPIQGGFAAGTNAVPFNLPDLPAHISVMICFEDVFPHLVREYVFDDTDFLVNLTNDGWFGEGAAQWQQAAAAVFRAVENGVPLVQCSNNGLTGWIDAEGRLREIFETPAHSIYGSGYLVAKIPALPPGTSRARTFYREHGDVFGWACVAYSLLALARVFRASRASQRQAI